MDEVKTDHLGSASTKPADGRLDETSTINFWTLLGKDSRTVELRCQQIWKDLCLSEDYGFAKSPRPGELFFYDTGNLDVRTEGQSYAMLMAVLMDDQPRFDSIWRWTLRHMYLTDGPCRGYFAWSVPLNNHPRAKGPASDGEEFFALALFLAARRWHTGPDQTGYAGLALGEYQKWGRRILQDSLERCSGEAGPLWPANNLIVFVPGADFTDPSYHLPHFYQLFAEEDPRHAQRWLAIEKASLAYLPKTFNYHTGMSPEYSLFNGLPQYGSGHHNFYSDAYRCLLNIALMATWPGRDAEPWMKTVAVRLANFFADLPMEQFRRYELDGRDAGEPALHPVGLLATLATSFMLEQNTATIKIAERFWQLLLRTGQRRYYDNFLYAFSFLALAGRYQAHFAS
ncbi:MAG: glycosyl hydrolase family 8 [Oscillospiraceae bacterium]|nr:glycosyl hydrolase family 8 [Oscillospiraceae bacterium]